MFAHAGRSKDVKLNFGPGVDSIARPAICGLVAQLGTETDKVRYSGETSSAFPQRELHVFLQLALDVLRRTQKDTLGRRDDSRLTFLVEDITSGSMRPLLSHFQPAVRFL